MSACPGVGSATTIPRTYDEKVTLRSAVLSSAKAISSGCGAPEIARLRGHNDVKGWNRRGCTLARVGERLDGLEEVVHTRWPAVEEEEGDDWPGRRAASCRLFLNVVQRNVLD